MRAEVLLRKVRDTIDESVSLRSSVAARPRYDKPNYRVTTIKSV